ncbi:hypothetical protein RI129_004330 [Pyrocoelia pectoralis]|uniref:DUF1279 domain-containing protein n=1 Tax=Pyrocoelia pectoralis TaxID=417401 RepID=A0AAN7VI27_9COLE
MFYIPDHNPNIHILSVNALFNKPQYMNISKSFQNKYFSTSSESDNKVVELTRKEKLKRAVKQYGSTVIIFHVTISLASLGVCYLLVSSGLDMNKILSPLGLSGTVATNAGTFVTAYAIHKVFAPVRISITLGATPFIVRYLRRIGFLKVKMPKSN